MRNLGFTFAFLMLTFFFHSQIHAQQITGAVYDDSEPLSFVNIVLHSAVDSSVVKFTYSEDDGSFILDNVQEGNYFIRLSYVGMNDVEKSGIVIGKSNVDLGVLTMAPAGVSLGEVLVTAQKPLLEVKPDKLVLNVANSVLASGDDALSLLSKAPGVLVDNNDRISLSGKNSLQIYIDGKPSRLSGADLANYLKSLSANDIENIEIINNPSARFDAEGTGGIINIVRRKSVKSGMNGTVNATYRQGLTDGTNIGTSFNYGSSRLNLFSNFSVYNQANWNFNNFNRTQNGLGFVTNAENNSRSKGLNGRVNLDYRLTDKSSLGLIAEANVNRFNMTVESETQLGDMALVRIDSLLINNGVMSTPSNNTALNLNYFLKTSDKGSFNFDVNYNRFNRTEDNFTPNLYYNADRTDVTSRFEIRNVMPSNIDIAVAKMDYDEKYDWGAIAVGAKSTLVRTDNDLRFYNKIGDEEILNADRSNTFYYDEWVNAAYINYNNNWGAIGLNLGMRVEHSYTKGDLIAHLPENSKMVERNYLNAFPSAGISWAPSAKHSLQLSYSRRINRPNYRNLNPFESQLDELTFEKGNAFLNPEYSDNISITHSFNYLLTTTFNYSHTSDVITRLVDISGEKASFITFDNLASRKVYSLGVSAPIPFSSKWSSFTNINAVYTRNNADFGEGKIIDIAVYSVNAYHQQTFRVGAGWTIEASGWYTSPSIWEGNFLMSSMWAVTAGVSKALNNGMSKISVNVDDIFRTNTWNGESRLGGLMMIANGGWDSRRVRVNFTHSFGQGQRPSIRKRSTGIEEESQRIQKD